MQITMTMSILNATNTLLRNPRRDMITNNKRTILDTRTSTQEPGEFHCIICRSLEKDRTFEVVKAKPYTVQDVEYI